GSMLRRSGPASTGSASWRSGRWRPDLLGRGGGALAGRLAPLRGRGALVEPGLEPRQLLLDAVQAVLDPLEPLRDRAQPAGQALQVAGRGKVQRAERRLLGMHGTLARL